MGYNMGGEDNIEYERKDNKRIPNTTKEKEMYRKSNKDMTTIMKTNMKIHMKKIHMSSILNIVNRRMTIADGLQLLPS